MGYMHKKIASKLTKKAIEFFNNKRYSMLSNKLFIFVRGGSAMALDRIEFLDVLADSYSAYYDIRRDGLPEDLPLVFEADYYSRAERFWLSKKITIWANETNELAYIFSAPVFDEALSQKCIDFALEDALPKVKPHKEHQYTNVKVLLVADRFDQSVVKYIQGRKFSRSYNHSLYGFTLLKAAAVDLAEEKAYPNKAGYEIAAYFKKLFAARRKGRK